MSSTVEPGDEGGWLSGARLDDDVDEPAVSWGPGWGPETGEDVARPAPAERRRGLLHPPGGSL